MSFDAVENAMETAVARRVFPGAVLLVREGERVFYHRAFGHRSLEPTPTPLHENTIFDVSSLTKPFATGIATMFLVQEGKVRLDDRVSRFFHNFGVHGKTHITFRQLLSHSSGLPAWRAYYKEIQRVERQEGRVNFIGSPQAKEFVYQLLQRERPEAPPATKAIYSDLGFMLLGATVEAVSGVTLDRYCQQRIFRPLGLRSTGFVDLAMLRTRQLEPVTEMIAPTERCPWRKKILCGEVHDDNAHAMGGVAGHAGLFSSAAELDTILCWLKSCHAAAGGSLRQGIVRTFWTRDEAVRDSTWCLAWDSPAATDSSAGTRISPRSVGHLGFTGTSVWLDLERDRHVILLSNRVHPSRDNDAIKNFRPLLHDLVWEALE